MRNKQPLRRFDSIMHGVVLEKELSNKTPIHKSASHVGLICPVCGVHFTRKASEVKRNNVSYCGRGCFGVSQRIQVTVGCKLCGRFFSVKRSLFGVITFCSSDCRKKFLSHERTLMNLKMWESGKFKFGSQHKFAKLTEVQVSGILRDRRLHSEIAEHYGVTRAAISFIKSGKTWGRSWPST